MLFRSNPGYATAHHWYADYLTAMGRSDEALAEGEQAAALDPLSASIRGTLGTALYMARHYAQAITELRSSLDLDSGVASTHTYLAYCYEQQGLLDQAVAETQRGLQVAPGNIYLLAELGRLSALRGDRAGALRVAADLEKSRKADPFSESIAYIYAALGDNDRAFQFLRKAEQSRSVTLIWAKVDPIFDSLRGDPRFADLLRSLRLG